MIDYKEPRSAHRIIRKDVGHQAVKHQATEVSSSMPWGTWTRYKILMDFAVAATLLVLSAPFMLMAMILVKLTSRGPALYAQKRLGLDGRIFTIYKIRSMWHNCESTSGPRWSSVGDARITPVGRILRATHLDELPQLWNVLRGEMSLVGPRPERPEIVPLLEQSIPQYRERLRVLPGLTGLAQVQLPPDTDLQRVRRKLACDLYYVQFVGPWLDLRIMVGTACYLLGIPFAWTCKFQLVPTGSIEEMVYRSVNRQVDSLTQLRTA